MIPGNVWQMSNENVNVQYCEIKIEYKWIVPFCSGWTIVGLPCASSLSSDYEYKKREGNETFDMEQNSNAITVFLCSVFMLPFIDHKFHDILALMILISKKKNIKKSLFAVVLLEFSFFFFFLFFILLCFFFCWFKFFDAHTHTAHTFSSSAPAMKTENY